MSRPTEERPLTRLRKSTSGNKMTLTGSKERRNMKNLVDLGPIIGNVKSEVIENDCPAVLQEVVTDQKSAKKHKKRSDTSTESGDCEDVGLDNVSFATSSSNPSKLTSPSTSYKEKNSSIQINDYKLSQGLIQFHLLGRKFLTLSDLGSLPSSDSRLATVVVVVSKLVSPLTSSLVVADRSSCSRLNLVAKATQFWHTRLKIGQVLLLTKMGVLRKDGELQLVQIACQDGVKVVGMVADVTDLNLEQGCYLKVRMSSNSKASCQETCFDVGANDDEERDEIGTDMVKDVTDDEDRAESGRGTVDENIEVKSSPSHANEKAKKTVLVISDDSEDDTNAEKKPNLSFDNDIVAKSSLSLANEKAKKAVLSPSDDSEDDTNAEKKPNLSFVNDMVYHGMLYSLPEDFTDDSSLHYEVIDDDDKPIAASEKKSKVETNSTFDSLITEHRRKDGDLSDIEHQNNGGDRSDDTVPGHQRKDGDRENQLKDGDRSNVTVPGHQLKDGDFSNNTGPEYHKDGDLTDDTELQQNTGDLSDDTGHQRKDGASSDDTVSEHHHNDDDLSEDTIIYHSTLGKRNLSKAADGYAKENKKRSNNPSGPEDDDREVDRLCNLESLDGGRRANDNVRSKQNPLLKLGMGTNPKISTDNGTEASEILTYDGNDEKRSEVSTDNENDAFNLLEGGNESEDPDTENDGGKRLNPFFIDNFRKNKEKSEEDEDCEDSDGTSSDENETEGENVIENEKTSFIRYEKKSAKKRKRTPYLLSFPLSESDDDSIKKIRRKTLTKKKSTVFDSSSEDTAGGEFPERNATTEKGSNDLNSDSSEIDFVEFRKRRREEYCTAKRKRLRSGINSDGLHKKKLKAKRNKDSAETSSSDNTSETSDSDGASSKSGSVELGAVPQTDDCSCPKCSPESYDMVTFSQRDIVTVCRKAVRNIPASPAKEPVELDTYLADVEVSFEEEGNIAESQADLERPSGSQANYSSQKSPAKKSSQADLGELWLGRVTTVAKGRSKANKNNLEQKNTEDGTAAEKEKEQEEEDIDEEEGEYGVKETYIEYNPVHLTEGVPHPDTVVESCSLASVSPPAITRTLSLPKDIIESGKLSMVQLESVTYASQMHEVIMFDKTRAGYLIGDGAGVGKGRTIAGIILENWVCGRKKSVWVSASQDLLHDASRDLDDIGVEDIQVVNLSSFSYDKKLKGEMVVYSTFAGLVGTSKKKTRRYSSRLQQLQEWLGTEGGFDGPLVFDECHKAKNLVPPKGGKPTKTGLAVVALQNKNPMARVVYASATGASEPKNMAYMVRLGMWGQNINFKDFTEFSKALEKRGTGGLEQVALDLKLRGSYIARQLSFKGVDFTVEEVPLSEEFIEVYNDSVEVWRKLKVVLYDQCMTYPIDGRGDPRKRSFWGFMQKFFKYLAISSKISFVVGLAKKELKKGNCVVIGLQSTGEAATELEMITKTKGNLKAGEMDDFINDDSDTDMDEELLAEKTLTFSSAASKILRSVVCKLIPCQHNQILGSCDPERCEERRNIWRTVMELAPRLPTTSLDQLIEQLGGPRKVAELTGRKKRLEKDCDGVYSYVKRTSENVKGSDINIAEKTLFMEGKKKIAIISEAGSTGISLQADKRVENQRRRIHMTIELPWSADSAIQQFGRTHRSNQTSAPKYVFVISALHGEKRFASIVAKRLESLGALTHGDRRSTRTSDLSAFNFHTEHASTALKCLVLAITEGENIPMPKHPPRWKQQEEFYTWLADRMEEAGIYEAVGVMEDEQYPTMTKFMNRLLCVKVEDQNVIFSYFSATLDRVVAQAKREGRYDSGIVDVVGQEKASLVNQHSFEVRHATGITTTKVTKLLITRGMSFEEALHKFQQLRHKTEGFWLSQRPGLNLAILVVAIPDAGDFHYWKYLIYRPNTGKVFDTENYDKLREKYRKVKPEVAKKLWDKQYELSLDLCFHAFRAKDHTCKTIRNGGECEEGRRRRNYHVVSGSLLSVWPQIEKALSSCSVKRDRKIQMIRINNDQGRIIGIKIPNEVAGNLIQDLKDLDLTGVADDTAGENTGKKTNTEAESQPNGESGDTVIGGKSGKESVREIEDESVEEKMEKESESESDYDSVNRYIASLSESDNENANNLASKKGIKRKAESESERELNGEEKKENSEVVHSKVN